MHSPNRRKTKQEYAPDEFELDPDALPNDPRIDRVLDRYLKALGSKYLPKDEDHARFPGIAVMVRQGNEIVHMNCYGYANLETKTKVTPATLFDLGSLSKQFTAVAVLGLVYFNEISRQDPISKFFSEFPRYADCVTVEQLIHHTSAVPEYVDIYVASRQADEKWYHSAMEKDDDWYPRMTNRGRQITNKDVIRWIASQALLPREPNTEFEYSNSGYVLLAELVERVSKKRFSDYLKVRVFDWMEMADTYVFDENSDFAKDAPQIVNHALCYNGVKGKGFVPVGYTPLNFIYGDGNVHSTIVDLAKWDLNLHRLDYLGLVTKDESSKKAADEESSKNAAESFRELLWEPTKVENNKQVNYGAGWNLLHNKYEDDVEENGERVTKKFESRAEYHRGVWLGWRSYFARATRWLVPEDGKNVDPKTWESLGIIVLSNCSQVNTCRVAQHISRLYWGRLKKDNIMNHFNCE